MSEILIIISASASLFSAIAAVLAWTAKLRWSTEFAAAKDETIKSKDAQITALRDQFQETIRAKDTHLEALKELTPMRLREYFNSVKEQLEEFNNQLGVKLAAANSRIQELEQEIQKERDGGEQNLAAINRLNMERDELTAKVNSLKHRLQSVDLSSRRIAIAQHNLRKQVTLLQQLDAVEQLEPPDDDDQNDG